MAPQVWIWGTAPADQYLAGRAQRSLAAFAAAEYVPWFALAGRLMQVAEPVWLLRAGVWPIDPARVRMPPASATGLPLWAEGDCSHLAPRDEKPALQFHADNKTLNSRSSAILTRSVGATLYLEPPLAAALGEHLATGESFESAAAAVQAELKPRVIQFPPLNVRFDPRLRVLQVVTSLQRGGAERVALDLAMELPRQGVPCRIVTIGGPTREMFAVAADHMDLSRYRGDRLARAKAIESTVRDFGADVVHAHLIDAEDALLIAAGIPLVMTIHNQRPAWPAGLREMPTHGAALLAACSQTVERELCEDKLATPIRTVWNGIDFTAAKPDSAAREAGRKLRKELGLGREDLVLLALANPRPQKRFDLLPAVLAATRAELAQAGSDRQARLVFCGEQRQGNAAALGAVAATEAEVARLKLGAHVRWLGSVADVAAVLAASDVLVSTSAYEGLSLAQVEGLAAGLPIVITDVGGAADIAHSNPAVTVLPRDSPPEEFARAIVSVVQSRPMGGVQTARRDFTHVRMTERYRWQYPRAIAAHQRAGAPAQSRGLWLITNNFSMGGAQSSARRLLVALKQQGVPVRAAVLEEQPEYPTPGRQALLAAGILVVALPTAGTLDAGDAVAELLAHIDADPPAAVLCWNALAEYKLLLADALLEIPLYDISPGEMYFTSLERYFRNPRPALPYRTPAEYGRRLAGAIVKYEAEAERAAATLGCPVHVVPNGLELDVEPRKQPATAGRLIIGTSARLSPQKKLEELLAALRKAHGQLPPYVLRIAGGPERGSETYAANLKRLAQGLPVEWLGELGDVRPFLRELDLFVMISEPAGCPNASLEALAAGVPVIATDFGGAGEQIEHGVSGLLTPRGDTAALAASIVAAAHDPALRQRLAQAGRVRIAERFNLARMVEGYRRICLSP